MQDNTAKYKVFTNGAVLYGPAGVGQNLNTDVQKNTGDELDAILNDLLGASAVLIGLQVQTTTGLAVNVTTGTAFVSGQRVRQTSTGSVTLLPASTTGIKIYVQAGATFSVANRGWPAAFGFTTSALSADQLLLATVATDGSGVTAIVDGRVFFGQLANGPTAPEKAALAGTGATAPSGSNKFVVNDDVRFQALADLLTAAAQFVTVDVAQIITAVHTLNPAVAGPPLLLGVNAQNRKVIGLDADRLDGEEGAAFHDAVLLTGILSDARLPATVPRLDTNNVFTTQQTIAPATAAPPLLLGSNAQNQKVTGLHADMLDGEEGTAFHDAVLLTGTLPDARLSTNIPNRITPNTFTAPQTIAPTTATPPLVLGVNAQGQKVIGLDTDKLDGQEGAFYQNAANLTGTLADARLSTNVPRRDVPGLFTGKPNFSVGAEVGTGNDVWHEGNDPKYGVGLYNTFNQPILNDSAWHFLIFNSRRYDIGNMAPTGEEPTIPKTGRYTVTLNLAWTNNATGTFRGLRLFLNGVSPIAPYVQVPVSPLGGNYMNGSHTRRFTLGDVLQVQVAHNATTNIDILAQGSVSPEFTIDWVGP